MKTLILIFLLIAAHASAQEIIYSPEGSVSLKFESAAKWEEFKRKAIFLNYEKKECDSLASEVYRPAIKKQSEIIAVKDSIITMQKAAINRCFENIAELQSELIDIQTRRPPAFEFFGLQTGLRTGYMFADPRFTGSTFTNAIVNNLSAVVKTPVRVKDFYLTPALEVPLNNRSTGLYFEITYKLF